VSTPDARLDFPPRDPLNQPTISRVVSTSTTSTPTPPEPQSVTWQKRAIRRALGDHMPAVYAPKAALGNSLGAAGAVEAVLTCRPLRDGVVPPTT
jgi:3-oxoacyl-(acyl-carrier-protein) synthase